ncbi:unnamed protein product [Cylicocyclus nassatus]|uniref:Uncharacterized protein n=1 Tax=Cylicocyclus nassatus TaxID=53992 RepID=A0AA36H3Y9_CYLNA|nr:unnamed protein product [Cylicocyclus nassatus]
MKKRPEDVIEFPDSTFNVKLAFSEKDLKLLDDERTDTTDTSQVPRGSNSKFTAALGIVASTGFLIVFLNTIAYASPFFSGLASLVISMLAYEWQCLYGTNLSRIPRASLNYTDLLNKNRDYIPFFTLGWLMGERYKPFVLGGIPDEPDDRTPNEPEAISPERQLPTDPKFLR